MTSSLFNAPAGRSRHITGESLGINGGLGRLGGGLDADPTLLYRGLIVGQISGKWIERTVRFGLGFEIRIPPAQLLCPRLNALPRARVIAHAQARLDI